MFKTTMYLIQIIQNKEQFWRLNWLIQLFMNTQNLIQKVCIDCHQQAIYRVVSARLVEAENFDWHLFLAFKLPWHHINCFDADGWVIYKSIVMLSLRVQMFLSYHNRTREHNSIFTNSAKQIWTYHSFRIVSTWWSCYNIIVKVVLGIELVLLQ